MPPDRIAILGFGLIGGSVARALAARRGVASGADTGPLIRAWSPSGDGPSQAAADGVIDAAAGDPREALEGADLVIIAAPPLQTIGLLGRLGGDLRGALAVGAVTTDVTSTKAMVMVAAKRAAVRFVGGHPMAGRETVGYGSSTPDLFRDRPWLIVPPEPDDPGAVAVVRWLADRCGARPIHLSAAEHDAATAAISHLPLVVSAALVDAVAGDGRASPPWTAWPLARTLAASGWVSMTRLALGDPRMGAGIVATNSAAILEGLHRYRASLDAWIAALEAPDGPDAAALEARLQTARAHLDREDGGQE